MLTAVCTISQLLKHCNDTETPWTVEAASRSSFWTTDLGKSLIKSSVDIDLNAFGSPTPGCIRFASSLPLVLRSCASLATASRQKSSTDVALGQLYRALASVMLEHLHVRTPQVPPLAAAQVATGMQPRKFPLAPVPEFKRFVQIAVPQCPPLDSKNRLLTTLRVQDTVVPAGSKLVPPLSRLAADRVEGEGLICNQVHRTSQAGASLAEHNPDASDASSGVNQAAPPPCGSAGAFPSSSGLVGAACDSVHPSCDADMPPRMQSVGRAAPSSCGSPAFPFSPSGVGGAAPLALSPTCSGSLVCATECEAEMLASNLGARVDASSLVSIFETLPAEVPARGVDDAREKAWTAGAYSQNKLCGLRKHTRAFPRVVSAAVRYLRTCFPDACFATIAFYSNVCTPMHRDANNLEGTLNYVAPLTSFKDGGIWVQDDGGTHSRMTPCGQSTGRVLQVCEGPVHFDAHRFHCTLPWLGSRIVLIGFTPRNLSSLKQSDTRLLLHLGFPLPGHNPPILPAIAAPQVDGADTPQVELAEERDRELCTLTFGVYHTESEFVRAAVKAGHPKAMVDSLPAHLESCIDLVSKAPPSAIVERRKQWLDKWTARAAKIGVRPDPIWEVEDPHMREVLRSKRLQLLDEIIASEGYEDVSLASDIRSGFDLVGTSPVSNVLPGKVSPASLHPDDVSAAAGRANEALRMSLGSSGDHATDLKLWEKTMQEVDRGWLVGPYGWDDLPDGYVVSHRFPLWQHDKLRPIDDYSRSGVNACVTTLEQPTVDTADVAAAMFAKLCEGLGKAKRPSWIKGRSFDLTAAYRQLCVSTASRKFAVIAVYNPHTGKTCLFTQICLPFGSRASVNGFIRCSRCIQWLATRCLLVPTTSYYDDFIVASPDCLADNTGSTMELLFQLLGWVFDTVGPKADTFSRDVSALGLHFDLSESGGGVVTVDNTEKRKRDIHALVSDVLAKGQLSYKGGMELRGKLAFANSQVMGKAGHYALKHVSTHVHAYPFMPKLSAATTDALSFLMARILEGQPRRIHKPLGLPWFVYTDASFEPDYTGGLGGVLISPSGSVVGWFSLLLESADIRPLLPLKAETGIGELEAIAVVLAFQLWEEHLKSTECVAYLDNEGARCSLIKGCSSSWSITRICHIFAKTCESHTVLPWLARVPSYWQELYNNPLIARDNDGFKGAEQLWVPAHKMKLRAREHYRDHQVIESSEHMKAPSMETRDMLAKHLNRQDMSFSSDLFNITAEQHKDVHQVTPKKSKPAEPGNTGEAIVTPEKTKEVNLTRERPMLHRQMESGMNKLRNELSKQLGVFTQVQEAWQKHPSELKSKDRAALQFLRIYQFRFEVIARLAGQPDLITKLVPDKLVPDANAAAGVTNPPSPGSVMTGHTQEDLTKAAADSMKMDFQDFLAQEFVISQKFWDGDGICTLDSLRQQQETVLDCATAEEFLASKKTWQDAEKAIHMCVKGSKVSSDDVIKHLKSMIAEDKRQKKRKQTNDEKEALKKARLEATEKVAEIKSRKAAGAAVPSLFTASVDGIDLVQTYAAADLATGRQEIWRSPWKLAEKHEALIEALGDAAVQKSLAAWGAQYKRMQAQTKLDTVTVAMQEGKGKEVMTKLFESLAKKSDVTDVTSVPGGSGFMSACWLYGCAAEIKTVNVLPNHSCMMKLLVSGEVRHIFLRAKGLLGVLYKMKAIDSEHDLMSAIEHLKGLDAQGLLDLCKSGVEILETTQHKGELLFVPVGWVVVEIANPSVHLFGVRKSFMLSSSADDYELFMKIVAARGQNVERMTKIHELMMSDKEKAKPTDKEQAKPAAKQPVAPPAEEVATKQPAGVGSCC
ncbi:unnamed protein product [Symbiodinium sp. CCMP2592]|nr:unnamed protein product [Symbiodinium sp. CCMP2592]